MLIILIEIFTLLSGLIIRRDDTRGKHEMTTSVTIGLSSVLLFFSLLFLFIIRLDTRAFIAKHEQLRKDYKFGEIEQEGDRAGIFVEVTRSNQDLVSKQYYHQSLWTSWFYPSDIEKVNIIR